MDTTENPSVDAELLDETYTRLRATGPEFQGWLSNHGPMAADAMIRLGHSAEVENWVTRYLPRLEGPPASRWEITHDEWQEALGDPARLGDWIALFDRELGEQPWRDVQAAWWPRLIDGAVASATHGLIRTGHAVRALIQQPAAARTAELAQALGYWAARHQRLPDHPRPSGITDALTALQSMPTLDSEGGIGSRLDDLARTPSWPPTVARLHPVAAPADVPDRLDALVDAAVTYYGRWAHGNPVMLVHAATAPRAARLVLPGLPEQLWIPTFEAAWAVTAAIGAIYRPPGALPVSTNEEHAPSPDQVIERAIDTADEHAIKFAEVVQESHRRGNPDALSAGALANRLIAATDGG